MPAGHANWMGHGPDGGMPQRMQFDAGTVLLMALSPHPMLGMMGLAHGPGMMQMEGAPPQ